MVKLSIAFHDALPGDDPCDSNLWFDAEVNPQDLLDALDDDDYEGMTRLLSDCYDEASKFYRVDDNDDEVTLDEDVNPCLYSSLGHDEWHVDVDWHNGRYLTILGAGFGAEEAESCEKEVKDYLKECKEM